MAPEKYHTILRFAHGFLSYQDPFSIAIHGEDTHVKALGILSSAASSTIIAPFLQSSIAEPLANKSQDNACLGKKQYEGSRTPTTRK
jgi:hypothetical protein